MNLVLRKNFENRFIKSGNNSNRGKVVEGLINANGSITSLLKSNISTPRPSKALSCHCGTEIIVFISDIVDKNWTVICPRSCVNII